MWVARPFRLPSVVKPHLLLVALDARPHPVDVVFEHRPAGVSEQVLVVDARLPEFEVAAVDQGVERAVERFRVDAFVVV